jgi:hypothetical protein
MVDTSGTYARNLIGCPQIVSAADATVLVYYADNVDAVDGSV